jgi:hypothetical protein
MTMREIPDKYHEALWEITGAGSPPKAVQAAVAYIEGEAVQDDCAEAFDVDPVTIRKNVERIIDMGVVDLEYVQENCKRPGLGQFGEYTDGERTWKPKP